MTAERYRAPLRQGAPAAGYSCDTNTLADLFGLNIPDGNNNPHPDFSARAAIWRDHSRGLISFAEAQRRSAAVGTCIIQAPSPRKSEVSRPRHKRPAPSTSRQYAGEMATTAARDDRLTPNAKALLQVLRARCGKGRTTETTKTTLASIMARSARTIRRYLGDLEAFGYIKTEIRRTGRGFHTGLVVTITEQVLAFYEDAKGLAAWLAETPAALFRPFNGSVLASKGMTKLTPRNQTSNILSCRKMDTSRRAARGRLLSGVGANAVPT